MAEITASSAHSRPAGVRRCRKLSTRVDLTPMVDLGFLLITFFIFTTSLEEARVTPLLVPANGSPMNVGRSNSLTLIPTDSGIFFYHGELSDAFASGTFGTCAYGGNQGLGALIRQKQAAMESAGRQRRDLMLIIEPGRGASYGDLVKILDEVLINEVHHYALAEASATEKATLLQKGISF